MAPFLGFLARALKQGARRCCCARFNGPARSIFFIAQCSLTLSSHLVVLLRQCSDAHAPPWRRCSSCRPAFIRRPLGSLVHIQILSLGAVVPVLGRGSLRARLHLMSQLSLVCRVAFRDPGPFVENRGRNLLPRPPDTSRGLSGCSHITAWVHHLPLLLNPAE